MEYEKLVIYYREKLSKLTRMYNLISYVRLFLVLVAVFLIYQILAHNASNGLLGLLSFTVVLFVLLLRRHNAISTERSLVQTLLEINQKEIEFIKGNNLFEDGSEYIDHQHLYSFDLDIFGKHSLFQYLNRTATYLGKCRLAKLLLAPLSKMEILSNQDAIAELKPNLPLRQKVNALALQFRDNEQIYHHLEIWAKSQKNIRFFVRVLMHILPIILFGLILIFALTLKAVLLNYMVSVFIINLMLLGMYGKQIKKELFAADKIDGTLRQYSLIMAELERQDFRSRKLRSFQDDLIVEDETSSDRLGELAYLMAQLETINNGLVAMIFSGLGCYHLFILRRLYRWKRKYANYILPWISTIADFEVLSSLSTFYYNNDSFAIPAISDDVCISFRDMGHPLVPATDRVGNDINFDHHRFFILTGSNMSGKSTFLRCIGVNLVLAGAGAPVCAQKATVYPMNILVSMRVADSLADNESYFYAEVKRLKQISLELGKKGTMVLLDEILRGTNSNDKRQGTLEVIRRMTREGVYGVIATHDLEICKEVEHHPTVLANKCFEVEIRDNELNFDYKLRDGICENQSATFLMKKTGII